MRNFQGTKIWLSFFLPFYVARKKIERDKGVEKYFFPGPLSNKQGSSKKGISQGCLALKNLSI
jgi:hypothetical protein